MECFLGKRSWQDYQGRSCLSQDMKRPLSFKLTPSIISSSCAIARSLLNSFSGFTFCTPGTSIRLPYNHWYDLISKDRQNRNLQIISLMESWLNSPIWSIIPHLQVCGGPRTLWRQSWFVPKSSDPFLTLVGCLWSGKQVRDGSGSKSTICIDCSRFNA